MKAKLYQVNWHYKGDSPDDGWMEAVDAPSKADCKRRLAKKYGVKPTDIIISDAWKLS